MQELYKEPIKPELITKRIREVKDAGVIAAASLTPQRVTEYAPLVLEAELDVFVIQGTVVSGEHVSSRLEPLNLKEFIPNFDIPVIVGGCASYATALHLMRTWLEAERSYAHIPGVSAAIVSDQQILWDGGFGYSDLARQAPATASTIYSICSISKLFTSVATMQLRDAGKLRLDDPVAKHLPWFTIKQTNFDNSPDSVPVIARRLVPRCRWSWSACSLSSSR